MKEGRGALQDVIGLDQPKAETKIKKYIKISLTVIFLSGLALLIVAAAMRKFGS